MNRRQLLSLGVLGILLAQPLMVFAEDPTGSTDGAPPVVTEPQVTSVDGSGTPPPPMRPMTRERLIMTVGPDGKPLPKGDVKPPRDAASGQPSGRSNGLPPGAPMGGARMMASGSKPLPPKMEREMEMRERMGSGTPMMDDRKGAQEERRQEMQQRMQERKSEIMKRQTHQMIERMKAAIERMSKLADRADSRIAKLKAAGRDTSKAEANIAIARAKIAVATAAVTTAEAAVDSAVSAAGASTASSTTPTDAGKPVRDALEKARDAVKAAHQALVDAIESLKANVKIEFEPRGSSTPEGTN